MACCWAPVAAKAGSVASIFDYLLEPFQEVVIGLFFRFHDLSGSSDWLDSFAVFLVVVFLAVYCLRRDFMPAA